MNKENEIWYFWWNQTNQASFKKKIESPHSSFLVLQSELLTILQCSTFLPPLVGFGEDPRSMLQGPPFLTDFGSSLYMESIVDVYSRWLHCHLHLVVTASADWKIIGWNLKTTPLSKGKAKSNFQLFKPSGLCVPDNHFQGSRVEKG